MRKASIGTDATASPRPLWESSAVSSTLQISRQSRPPLLVSVSPSLLVFQASNYTHCPTDWIGGAIQKLARRGASK